MGKIVMIETERCALKNTHVLNTLLFDWKITSCQLSGGRAIRPHRVDGEDTRNPDQWRVAWSARLPGLEFTFLYFERVEVSVTTTFRVWTKGSTFNSQTASEMNERRVMIPHSQSQVGRVPGTKRRSRLRPLPNDTDVWCHPPTCLVLTTL